MPRAEGNSAKQVADRSPGPWARWRTKARHARAIRFIETYCRAPKGHGAGRPLKLAPFQREWLEESLADGVRASVESIPRGNGKSTFKSALGLWALFDPDDTGDPQVPVVATTVKQGIKTIYGPAVRMTQLEPELGNRCKVYTAISDTKITVPSTNGEMFPIADDPDGLQGLDPSVGLVDEIGFLSVESWASLLLASGKRPRSLIAAIGTPGFRQSAALWHVRQTADPVVLYREYAGDAGCDIRDEDQWRQANPAFVAGFKSRDAFTLALSLPESLFRIFQLGQWVFGTQGWLGTDGVLVWGACRDPWDFVPGADTWVGVDVSRRRDSTAVVACQRRPDGRLHFKARIWYPKDGIGGAIDNMAIMLHIKDLDRQFRLVSVGFDPRFFDQTAATLAAERVPMVEYPQSVERMSPACGSAYEAITKREWSHDGDPEFQRHVLNAVLQLNPRGFTLKKESPESPEKIDATIAMVIAGDMAARTKPRSKLVMAL